MLNPNYGDAIYAFTTQQHPFPFNCIIRNCNFENNYVRMSGAAVGFRTTNYVHLNILFEGNSIQRSTNNVVDIYYLPNTYSSSELTFKVNNNHFSDCSYCTLINQEDIYSKEQSFIGNVFENINNEDRHLLYFNLKMLEKFTFERNEFRNININIQNLFYFSGALNNNNKVDLRYLNCTFYNINNRAPNSGLGLVYNIYDFNNKICILTYKDCHFENNQGNGKAGALYISIQTPISIVDSEFVGNSASEGGALFIASSTKINIERSRFYNNRPETGYSISISSSNPESVTIDSCVFEDEKGGINIEYTSQMTVEVINSSFMNSTLFIKQTNKNSKVLIDGSMFSKCVEDDHLCFDLSIESASFTFNNNIIRDLIGESPRKYFGLIKSSIQTIEIQGMKLINNSCNLLYGGGFSIQFEGIKELTFIDCTFTRNRALQDERFNRMPADSGYTYYNGDGGGIQIGFSSEINNQIE